MSRPPLPALNPLAAVPALALVLGGAGACPAQLDEHAHEHAGALPARADDLSEEALAKRRAALADLGESPLAAVLDLLGADVRDYTEHVQTLANPFFEGRAPGSAGIAFAADYMEFYFRKAGLQPAFPVVVEAADGTQVVTPFASFRQPFQAGTDLKIGASRVDLRAGGASPQALSPGVDYSVLGVSGSGTVTAPVVFVGYSLPEAHGDYASYAEGARLDGKIALVLRFEPMNEQGQSRWGSGSWTSAAGLEPKLLAAADRGAAGIILVNPPGADDPRAGTLAGPEDIRGTPLSIPVVMLSTDAADRLVRAADAQGRSLLDLRKLADDRGSVIDLPGATVTIEASVERLPRMTDNVGAVLPGKGALADQFIVIGGHYDHLGYGYFGSRDRAPAGKLHPGADDNASGTAAVLMLADKLSRAYADLPPGADARSILFMGFSAEESGLNGSRHYTRNPIVPMERHDLMINLDMIGRLRGDSLEATGVGTAEGLEEWVTPHFAASGLHVKAGPGGLGPSDHASFYRAGVPVLFFFTGLHDEYHMPTDEGWTVNPVGAVRIVELVRTVALAAATRAEDFVYVGTTAASDQPVGQVRSRVRFGIAPGDYSGAEPGVLVGEVFDGTSAAEAGLRAGDLMTRWNGKPIPNVEAWMPLLGEHSPGDVVEITYLRDGKEQTTKATLKGRAPGNR